MTKDLSRRHQFEVAVIVAFSKAGPADVLSHTPSVALLIDVSGAFGDKPQKVVAFHHQNVSISSGSGFILPR
jgi:hypothetical protein